MMAARSTAWKNRQPSYGLSLVAGLPFSSGLSQKVQQLQNNIEQVLPGVFEWYDQTHLHITLAALMRGRYRSHPPITVSELPANFCAFLNELHSFFANQAPFTIMISQPKYTNENHCILTADCRTPIRSDLSKICQKFSHLDIIRPVSTLHLTFGYSLQVEKDISGDLVSQQFSLSTEEISRVWLVHYSNRMLNQIVGKVEFIFGNQFLRRGEELLAELGIEI